MCLSIFLSLHFRIVLTVLLVNIIFLSRSRPCVLTLLCVSQLSVCMGVRGSKAHKGSINPCLQKGHEGQRNVVKLKFQEVREKKHIHQHQHQLIILQTVGLTLWRHLLARHSIACVFAPWSVPARTHFYVCPRAFFPHWKSNWNPSVSIRFISFSVARCTFR